MKVLITGGSGQLGTYLQRTKPANIEVIVPLSAELNLADFDSINEYLNNVNIDAIINAGAYTAVDLAEVESDQAYAVNAAGVQTLVAYCKLERIPLVHISTDFVFDGRSSNPYTPDDQCNPLSVYGASKLAGEKYALAFDEAYVVRTGWVYGQYGDNFVKTMLRLASEKDAVGVVADQIGTPTYAQNLALAIWAIILKRPLSRLFHFSDAGVASWYDFAYAIFEAGLKQGLIESMPKLSAVTSADFPAPAQRPKYSVLDKSLIWSELDIEPVYWRRALEQMLERLKTVEGSPIDDARNV
jgi:dTDP-4-dehydrorhamnose reductase